MNPVLREGNSDRRAPLSVKNYARKHPHRMGKWSSDSKSHVSHMESGDFFGSEQSTTLADAGTLKIEFVGADGSSTVLKDKVAVKAGEIVDAAVLSKRALASFIDAQIADAKARDVLFSVHLKATMMKVSDPVLFGVVVGEFYKDTLSRHADALKSVGFDPNNGIGDLYARIGTLPEDQQARIKADIQAEYAQRPGLAMVNSDKGITNLHVPSDVIVDASMPAMIRDSGQMWNAQGTLQDTKAVIPDRCYADVYQAVIDDCKAHGAFDPSTMGSVPNVGLMAQKAEEYGSHDKTFQMAAAGTVKVTDGNGKTVFKHAVEAGDLWRMCQVKDAPIQDWVKLAVERARLSDTPAVFWLDQARAHDAQVIAKVEQYLKDHDTNGLDIRILPPVEATAFSLERIRKARTPSRLPAMCCAITSPTCSRSWSWAPAPRCFHRAADGRWRSVRNRCRWFGAQTCAAVRRRKLPALGFAGEFLALAASLEHLGNRYDNPSATVLAKALDVANGQFLDNNKSPARKVGELDNRGSHFYLAMYWAQALAAQTEDTALQGRFAPLARALTENEATIVAELNGAQGKPVDIGGYYHPDLAKVSEAMRPSKTFNDILATLKA